MHINAGDCMSVCVYIRFLKKGSKANLLTVKKTGNLHSASLLTHTQIAHTQSFLSCSCHSVPLALSQEKRFVPKTFYKALPTKSTTDPCFNLLEGGHFFKAPIWTAMKWLQAIRTQESILGSYCCKLTGLFSVHCSQGLYSQHRFAQKRKALRDNWQKPSVSLQISLHPFYPPFLPRHVSNHSRLFTSDTNTCSLSICRKMAIKDLFFLASFLKQVAQGEQTSVYLCTL